tara:strand:+ start:8995 stop:10557 length:1563 start_codon:yes stop_codon:yes gene_type:complete
MSDYSTVPPGGVQVSDYNTADVDRAGGTPLNTGLLRRKYNFGDRVSELAIDQTPFFRILSKMSKQATDDPQFKYTERRPSFHKRYAYVTGHAADGAVGAGDTITVTSAVANLNAVGEQTRVRLGTDYKSAGNIGNVIGGGTTQIGGAGTEPLFFMKDQLIKIPLKAAATDAGTSDYAVCQIKELVSGSGDNANQVIARVRVVKPSGSAGLKLASFTNNTTKIVAHGASQAKMADSTATTLEQARTYVVGTAFPEGSKLTDTSWNDQPFSTGNGQTQIFRTEAYMTNTARATVTKYEPNEWARIWREKLIEHKWDIEYSILFGSQQSGVHGSGSESVQYTQGAVSYILDNGNIFSWSTSHSADSFLDDMSRYMDPRYQSSKPTIFFCSTDVYNWLHKLGGYFSQNVKAVGTTGDALGRADFAVTGKKNAYGLGVLQISTPYGDMNVVRNIQLDGTHVKMMAVNMSHAKIRPLVGNGVNRDTSVYVGVQSLENTGTDRRVDLILTELGTEFSMPETHAIWKV